MLAYAFASLPSGSSGLAVRDQLKRLLDVSPSAPVIETGPDDLADGLAALRAGRTINLLGVSGELNLDPETGEGPSDIQVLCVPSRGGLAAEALASGLYLNADTNKLSGAFDDAGQCGYVFPRDADSSP